ncbi:hypothetical protein ARMSODRAFT_983434 [Armillaria solidipes]|uniref:Uncharacterized protein n=1 Tax=Armillaria solidipes TaxID=1076256 RepID=A0A2H3AYY0_9AGAR|nr:hypothetical protein ARMSODRAFT_983434 [Armillaria solidipes]
MDEFKAIEREIITHGSLLTDLGAPLAFKLAHCHGDASKIQISIQWYDTEDERSSSSLISAKYTQRSRKSERTRLVCLGLARWFSGYARALAPWPMMAVTFINDDVDMDTDFPKTRKLRLGDELVNAIFHDGKQ